MTVNVSFFDRFTLLHFASGVGIGLIGTPLYVAAAVGAAWEVVENPLKDMVPEFFPNSSHDTLANALGDFMAFMAGAMIGSLPRHLSTRFAEVLAPLALVFARASSQGDDSK